MLIKIKNLKLQTKMGVYEWERDFKRDIIINAKLTIDDEKSLQSDQIEDTIDYSKIIQGIKDIISNNYYKLIEKMTQEVMNFIMQDKRIKACKLEIDKVAPLDEVESCSVIIEEKRS